MPLYSVRVEGPRWDKAGLAIELPTREAQPGRRIMVEGIGRCVIVRVEDDPLDVSPYVGSIVCEPDFERLA